MKSGKNLSKLSASALFSKIKQDSYSIIGTHTATAPATVIGSCLIFLLKSVH
jgi:hypothetical protein